MYLHPFSDQSTEDIQYGTIEHIDVVPQAPAPNLADRAGKEDGTAPHGAAQNLEAGSVEDIKAARDSPFNDQ